MDSQPDIADRGALSCLRVIDRLEVGPVRVEPRRIAARYRVVRGDSAESTELSYKYAEEVFDPQSAASRNLAALICAQVALNYGLFCDEIHFADALDRHDRKLLTEMARNTAREVYVNKLLQPNPYLVGEAAQLPPRKLADYLLARLTFVEPQQEPRRAAAAEPRWSGDPGRYAVLSSGGKESLLSFGLLQELGHPVEPIFINESGGHWNTALRAYRHFAAHVPGTARVWTNADRVFTWMLRSLPFVREDARQVRADIYPIRMWTVAVFLFGALPLLLKRGVGRLVIGDEHDTTRRVAYHGIPHYDGLYDQSRYFDEALTRFYRRKGWGVVQLSLLRPLSELLVQKALVERFPQLQRLQISCHSAHVEEQAVHPCGRCEKCRRVVAMLTALQADPRACGYTDKQIERCLAALAAGSLHQEHQLTQHLAHLLRANGALPGGRIGSVRARPRPEVTKLRFDPERSPVDGVPLDLREELYALLQAHADGAVIRRGRQWLDVDLAAEPALRSPFPFDLPPAATKDRGPATGTASVAADGFFVAGRRTR